MNRIAVLLLSAALVNVGCAVIGTTAPSAAPADVEATERTAETGDVPAPVPESDRGETVKRAIIGIGVVAAVLYTIGILSILNAFGVF